MFFRIIEFMIRFRTCRWSSHRRRLQRVWSVVTGRATDGATARCAGPRYARGNHQPWTRLVDFLREEVNLPGTKVVCREGGCGACTVVATVPDQENEGQTKTFSVHSCQTLVYSCAGWNIETVENLGNRYEGYHPIQRALHGFYGTQCGYCTPGMVMTMYGQTQAGGQLTSEKVEKSLDGNICRCTGYRPILDAFKSLAVDADHKLPNELHGAFVQTTLANAKIASVDPSEALKVTGVVTFVTAADVPGRNSFVLNFVMNPDPIFAEERSHYAGQPIGLLVAKDRDTAVKAAKLVKVVYEDIKEPVLTIKDALKVGGREEIAFNIISFQRTPSSLGDPEGQMKVAPHKLAGEFTQGPQYHFNMEPLSARVLPTEDGYDVFSTTQWATEAQTTAAQALGVAVNSINVTVRRLGGGYGAKVTRGHLVSTAAAVAARKVQQPVRAVLDLNTNMTCAGWRDSYLSKYEVGFDDEGKLLALKVDLYSDAGYVSNESPVGFVVADIQNSYFIPNLLFTPHVVNTDISASTYCRTPGRINAVSTIEGILNHVASYLKKDPLEVRLANMVPPNIPRLMCAPVESNVAKEVIIPLLMEKSSYTQRKADVEQFNESNTWKKKGLSLQPLYYGLDYPPILRYGMQVSIYEHDGTVAISHGGIEMGQGINTKVAQVVAHVLGVPIETIVVKPTDTMIGANSAMTAGSLGSDLCAHGLKAASTALKKRMDTVKEDIKKETGKDPGWLELVKKCHAQDVDLCERHWTPGKEHPERYNIWAACCTEVEVDILTGAYMINRVDLVEDSGRSMNPYVDIGQVEGALIMGFGLYTTEEVKFDPRTGQRLSDGTWEYKPPTALDIPADLRITLLPNAKNPYGVLGSKATGEPPICLAYSVVSALREAITSFRVENGDDSWFQMDTPLTVEAVHKLCGINIETFKLAAADK